VSTILCISIICEECYTEPLGTILIHCSHLSTFFFRKKSLTLEIFTRAFLTDTLIRPEQIDAILQSNYVLLCQYRLMKMLPFNNVDIYRRCRNVLIFRVLIMNGQRTGALLGLTPRNMASASVTSQGAVITVSYVSQTNFGNFTLLDLSIIICLR
jgi:hypothetical protein